MAVIAQQRYKLDIAPSGGWVIVYASQRDNGAREIEFEITNQGKVFGIPANINVSVQGVKSNGGYFTHNCTYSGNVVTMALADDMTDVIGKAICVLKFTNSSQQKLATAKFILNIDSDSSSEGVIIDTEAEEIFNQMLDEIRAQAASVSADIAELQSMVGSPLVASTVSAMIDHNKIYVYTGSESGYTNGNWYYWNGSAWTSGGVYNAVAINIDSTPTQGSLNVVTSGGVYAVLDSKVDKVSGKGLSTEDYTTAEKIKLEGLNPGLSEEAKAALLACFENVAWANGNGQDYYDALHDALYPATGLVSISAVFTQGSAVINEGDDLNTLKQYLVVTGYYGDGVSQVITDYALSGQLTEGTSTITVTKEGKTATFTVTVTGEPVLTVYVGRGADLNNMDQTVSQANRCVSEKIRFTNIAPITVQWEENTSYRFMLKNILLNGKADSPTDCVWMPDYNTQKTGDNTLFGWINSNAENTFSDGKNNLAPVAYSESSGYARIIFAPKSSVSDPLPSAIPSGHITINGKRYKIQTVQQ